MNSENSYKTCSYSSTVFLFFSRPCKSTSSASHILSAVARSSVGKEAGSGTCPAVECSVMTFVIMTMAVGTLQVDQFV